MNSEVPFITLRANAPRQALPRRSPAGRAWEGVEWLSATCRRQSRTAAGGGVKGLVPGVVSGGGVKGLVLTYRPPTSRLTPWPLSGVQGWLALFSAGEGVPGMDLERYSPDGEGHEAEALSFNLYPDGLMNAQFATDAVRLHLATPCILERSQPPPCEEVEVNAPWHLYSWPGPGGRLVSQRHDLPPYSMPHPSGSRWAWPEAGRICIEGTSSPAACFPLPRQR
jgi:hypothetical protein